MYSVWYYFKDFLSALPSLTLPVPSVQCVSQTDASGAVRSVTRDGKEWPVTFYFWEWQPREHHKALVVRTQPSNGRLARWALHLPPYTLDRPGHAKENADSLSKLYVEDAPSLLRPSVNSDGGEMLGGNLPT